ARRARRPPQTVRSLYGTCSRFGRDERPLETATINSKRANSTARRNNLPRAVFLRAVIDSACRKSRLSPARKAVALHLSPHSITIPRGPVHRDWIGRTVIREFQ